jgi:hypothetical protein
MKSSIRTSLPMHYKNIFWFWFLKWLWYNIFAQDAMASKSHCMSKSCHGLAILLDWSSQHSLLVLLIGKIIWWVNYFVISDLPLFRVLFSSLWVGFEICELEVNGCEKCWCKLTYFIWVKMLRNICLAFGCHTKFKSFFKFSFQYLCKLWIVFFIILNESLF